MMVPGTWSRGKTSAAKKNFHVVLPRRKKGPEAGSLRPKCPRVCGKQEPKFSRKKPRPGLNPYFTVSPCNARSRPPISASSSTRKPMTRSISFKMIKEATAE